MVVTKYCLGGQDTGGCVICDWDVLGDMKEKQSPDLQFCGDLILFKAELDSWI
jgi:hypothetical protein